MEEVVINHQVKDPKGKNVFVYEDKEYHCSILDNLNMLRKNRQFCDVILRVCVPCFIVIMEYILISFVYN